MNKIWEFFENMEELVYVADMESHELVYLNRYTRDLFGIRSLEELAGKKCYQVLQHSSAPCSACNNCELAPGYFKEWQSYNPILDKRFMIKATMLEEGGRRYRLELAMDISSQGQRGNIAYKYQNLESTINEGLRLALQQNTPSDSLDILMEYLGKALGGERTYIFEKNEKGYDDNTYEWTANGVTPEKDGLQGLPPEICAGWYRKFLTSQHVVIEDLEDIREEDPLIYATLKGQNIHSLVVVPLFDDGRAIGFYGIDNPPANMLDYASNMLQIMAHFIVSSLKRRNLLQELQRIGYYDQLTKFGNRYAMQEFIDGIQPGQSVGIVYCDVTGLKRVNDTEGHKAGDQLIVNCCDCMRKVFGEHNLFRIGGDELLVICVQIDEKTLLAMEEKLRRHCQEAQVLLAVGVAWERECYGTEVDKLMAEAEKRMYEDKSEYYRKNGIDRRR